MVSDEQRKEIAANLRSESEAWLDTFPDSTLNDEDNDAIMFDISRFVLFEGTPTVGEFYARLADLIDRPTCTVSMGVTGHVGVCMRCGAMIETRAAVFNAIEALPTRYCPNCGAEVIPDAERRD